MGKKYQCCQLLAGTLAAVMLVAGSSTLQAKPRRRPASGKAAANEAAKYRGPRRSISVLPSRQVSWAVPALEQLSLAVFESSPYFNALPEAPGNTAANAETLAGSAHFTKAQFTCQVVVTDVRRTGGVGASFNIGEFSGLRGYNIRVGTSRYIWFSSVRVLVYDARTGNLLSDREGTARVPDRGVYVDLGFDRFSNNKLVGWGIGFDRIRRTSLGQAVQQAVAATLDQVTADLADYPLEARIATVEENVVYLNVGRGSGLQSGDQLEVIRDKKLVTDPVTGEVLERVTEAIAELEVVHVREKVTTAKRVDENQLADLVRGDVARLVNRIAGTK